MFTTSGSQACAQRWGQGPPRLTWSPLPVAPQNASRTGQTTPFGGNRKGSGCCRPTGRWTNTGSWPTPVSSSGPSTGPSSCGCPTAGRCASAPASPSPSSRPWWPSAGSSVSPRVAPTLPPARVQPGGRSLPCQAQPLSPHPCRAVVPPPAWGAGTHPKLPMGGAGGHRAGPWPHLEAPAPLRYPAP